MKVFTEAESFDRWNSLVQALPESAANALTGPGILVSPNRDTLTVFFGFSNQINIYQVLDALNELYLASRFGFTQIRILCGTNDSPYQFAADLPSIGIRAAQLMEPIYKGNPSKKTMKRRFDRLNPEHQAEIREVFAKIQALKNSPNHS